MNRKKNFGISIIYIILSLLLISLSAVQVFAADEITDATITYAVERQIAKDPGCNLNNLDVETIEGIVTLSGIVNNILAKERSAKVAETVKGVRSVVNEIIVTPIFRPDSELVQDVEQALHNDPLSKSSPIEVKADGGKVILSGTVDSWVKMQLIGRIAKGVKGVAALENNLSIIQPTDRNDKDIQLEIDRRLHWDALVDDSLIEVKVDHGKVTLAGTVGSAAERREAHNDAWVAGVSSVDSDPLVVKWWARNESLRKDKYPVRDNLEISQAIKDAFLYDPRVNMFNIMVFVSDGRVTLSGTVDNLSAKRAAARDARNTTGVWKVTNFIKIRSHEPSDRVITNSIRDALLMDPYVDRFNIDVSVIDGDVYLSGIVDSSFEKAVADDIASKTTGVTAVHNRLIVQDKGGLTYSPYLDPWYAKDYNWYTFPFTPSRHSDAEILEEIQDELFWSPFVDSDDVKVSVVHGVATLTGTVESWGEAVAAVENALEGGALIVENNLVITH